MKALATLALAALLAGCGSAPKVVVQVDDVPQLAPNLAVHCPPLDRLEAPVGADVALGTVLAYVDDLVAAYGECATRDAGKAAWIEQMQRKNQAAPSALRLGSNPAAPVLPD